MDDINFEGCTPDEIDRFLVESESTIARIRTTQMAALRTVDRRQTPLADGCRSLVEWVTGRLDVAADTAKTMVATARRVDALPIIEKTARSGEITFDRLVAVARLAEYADEHTVLAESAAFDVAGIHRQAALRRRMSKNREQENFRDQYVTTQSNLDHTGLDFHGHLTGIAGRVFEDALHSCRIRRRAGAHARTAMPMHCGRCPRMRSMASPSTARRRHTA